jgi:ParB family chromosome partitioning protein
LTTRDEAAGIDALSGYLENIETRAIHNSRCPVRKDVGPIEELVASIMRRGLLEPIVVRPDREGFEVVAGSRRLEACRRLRIKRIPCHVVDLCDRGAYEISLMENLQRKTLNPLEEAEAFRKYVDDYGYGGISELAKRIGKSQSYVSRRIALLDLPDSLREELMRQRISPSAVGELSSLDEEGKAELTRIITETGVNTKTDVRLLARRRRRSVDQMSAKRMHSYYETRTINAYRIDRTLAKCTASLKEDMAKFDEAVNSLAGEDAESWVVREALLWHRRFMNVEADYLLRLRRKFRRAHNL